MSRQPYRMADYIDEEDDSPTAAPARRSPPKKAATTRRASTRATRASTESTRSTRASTESTRSTRASTESTRSKRASTGSKRAASPTKSAPKRASTGSRRKTVSKETLPPSTSPTASPPGSPSRVLAPLPNTTPDDPPPLTRRPRRKTVPKKPLLDQAIVEKTVETSVVANTVETVEGALEKERLETEGTDLDTPVDDAAQRERDEIVREFFGDTADILRDVQQQLQEARERGSEFLRGLPGSFVRQETPPPPLTREEKMLEGKMKRDATRRRRAEIARELREAEKEDVAIIPNTARTVREKRRQESEYKNIRAGLRSMTPKWTELVLMTSDELKRIKVCDVDDPTNVVKLNSVYDPRMGPTMSDMKCSTCFKDNTHCTGHYGRILFYVPLLHPMFIEEILNVLRCICTNKNCSRRYRLKEFPPGIMALARKKEGADRLKFLAKNDNKATCVCPSASAKAKYSVDETISKHTVTYRIEVNKTKIELQIPTREVQSIFQSIPDASCEEMGFSVGVRPDQIVRPERFILEAIPVAPPNIRPRMFDSGEIKDDALTIMYINIIKANNDLKKIDPTKAEYGSAVGKLFREVFNLMGVKTTMFPDSHTDASRNIKGRVSGKTKLRQHAMGKRVINSGRTVIGPELALEYGQFSLSKELMDKVTKKEYVLALNRALLQKKLDDGRVVEVEKQGDATRRIHVNDHNRSKIILEAGDVIHRKLEDGDYLINNRQPTLHGGGYMVAQVMANKTKGIGLNLANTSQYNADFDGDEMNFHVLQDVDAVAEGMVLSNLSECMIDPKSGIPLAGNVLDVVIAYYLMTLVDKPVSSDTFSDCIMLLTAPFDFNDFKKRIADADMDLYSTRSLASIIFPPDFYYNQGGVRVENGILMAGVVTKKHVGISTRAFHHMINKVYGNERTKQWLTDSQRVANRYMRDVQISFGYEDCRPIDKEERDRIIQRYVEEAELQVRSLGASPEEALAREKHEEQIKGFVNITGVVGSKIADQYSKDNPLQVMTESGAKGGPANVAQIHSLIGQQYLRGKRLMPKEQGGRTLSYYKYGEEEDLGAFGFIRNNFLEGMTGSEFFMHMMAGRQGLIDTSTSTAVVGAMNHKIAKAMEDLTVQYDGTVRNAKGQIVQMLYGYDGFAIEELLPVKVEGEQISSFMDMRDYARFLNQKVPNEKPMPLTKDRIAYMVSTVPSDVRPTDADLKDLERLHKKLKLPSKTFTLRDDFVHSWGTLSDQTTHTATRNIRQHIEKQCIDLELAPSQLPALRETAVKMARKALMVPGTNVGFLAASAMGQQVQQATLNTFHSSGSADNVTGGVEALNELINLRKERKRPSCHVHFNRRVTLAEAIMLGSEFVHVSIDDVLETSDILDTEDTKPWWYAISHMTLTGTPFVESQIVSGPQFLRLTFNRFLLSRFRLTTTHIAQKIMEKIGIQPGYIFCSPTHIGVLDILINPSAPVVEPPPQKEDEEEESVIPGEEEGVEEETEPEPEEPVEEEEEKLRLMTEHLPYFTLEAYIPQVKSVTLQGIPGITSAIPELTPVISIVDREEFEETEWRLYLNAFRMRRDGISADAFMALADACGLQGRVDGTSIYFDTIDPPMKIIRKKIEEEEEAYQAAIDRREHRGEVTMQAFNIKDKASHVTLRTMGTGYEHIIKRTDVDVTRTSSNNVREMNARLGIGASRAFLLYEIQRCIEASRSTVQPHNTMLFVDFMTHRGRLLGFAFTELKKRDANVFALATSEKAMDVFQRAAATGGKSAVLGPSADIMVNRRGAYGTGMMDIVLDTEKVYPVDMEAINALIEKREEAYRREKEKGVQQEMQTLDELTDADIFGGSESAPMPVPVSYASTERATVRESGELPVASSSRRETLFDPKMRTVASNIHISPTGKPRKVDTGEEIRVAEPTALSVAERPERRVRFEEKTQEPMVRRRTRQRTLAPLEALGSTEISFGDVAMGKQTQLKL